jgi:glycosyltransferase involved in cell wall biosynthesis
MRLSIVIPVYNALEHFKTTLHSIANNTDSFDELIIVDDASDKETRDFIEGLKLHPNLKADLIKIRLKEHSWTNAAWNKGVAHANGDHIAVVNSDITLSKHWDTHLIYQLKRHAVACPVESHGGSFIELDPVIEATDPNMIKGSCFMFKKRDRDVLFPIPSQLVHWCGDNYIADRANEISGVAFAHHAIITHAVTQSGRLIDKKLYWETVHKDVVAYQKMSGRKMDRVLREIMPSVLRYGKESQDD